MVMTLKADDEEEGGKSWRMGRCFIQCERVVSLRLLGGLSLLSSAANFVRIIHDLDRAGWFRVSNSVRKDHASGLQATWLLYLPRNTLSVHPDNFMTVMTLFPEAAIPFSDRPRTEKF